MGNSIADELPSDNAKNGERIHGEWLHKWQYTPYKYSDGERMLPAKDVSYRISYPPAQITKGVAHLFGASANKMPDDLHEEHDEVAADDKLRYE